MKRMRECSLGLLAGMLIGTGPVPDAVWPDDELKAGCVTWLAEHGSTPEAYACALLEESDVLFVGETHEIADNCLFVAELLKPAYKSGVRVLASEFLRSALNDRIYAVVTAPSWDDEAAIDLFREGPWPAWGYREYVDILKAAWSVNDALPDGSDPLRVVGIDDEWKQTDHLAAERMVRFRLVQAREEHMHAQTARLLDGSGKVLVHVGFAHSVFIGEHRLAARLRLAHGDRVQHLVLHHEISNPDGRSQISRCLDELYVAAGEKSVAFAMAGSPMDRLHDSRAMYARMLGSDARLSSFVEHYAILSPLDELRPVTWIPDFIQADRLAEAISVGERLRWIEAGAVHTVDEANAAFAARLRDRSAR